MFILPLSSTFFSNFIFMFEGINYDVVEKAQEVVKERLISLNEQGVILEYQH